MRKNVAQHAFSMIPSAEIPRSSFDRSHGMKTTFNAGLLVPVFLDEALPGDTFNVQMTAFARLATPIFPVMDNMYMDSFFFAVPYRLLWDNWEKFNGAQDNPGDSTDFLIPVIANPGSGFSAGSLGDYFGLPTLQPFNAVTKISALPFRAYNLIWNNWFRDENIHSSVSGISTGTLVPTGNGPDTLNNSGSGALLVRAKRHDYFTSALPWPQKGTAVSLPLAGNAPVRGMSTEHTTTANQAWKVRLDSGASPVSGRALVVGAAAPSNYLNESTTSATAGATAMYFSNAYADLSAVSAATINQLRQAFQIQRLLERDARGGTRYTEILRSHFGVVSPDARLQRPEYLGGGSTPVNITQVPQTSNTPVSGTPQGNLAAYGTVSLHGHGFTKSFTEHCIVIGMVMVRADLTYYQGVERMWSRQTRFDFYWPALSHIGEQTILNQEIYVQNNATNDIAAFGYQERYAEYRYKPSRITGLMRPNAVGTLSAWHLAQVFSAPPALNSTFIAEDPPIERVVAVPSQPDFIFDGHFSYRCARPMPLYGVPGMIDHF